MQELRHARTDQPRLDTLIHELDTAIPTLAPLLEAIQRDAGAKDIDLDTLHEDLEELSAQYASLKFDMKEDGWTAHFER